MLMMGKATTAGFTKQGDGFLWELILAKERSSLETKRSTHAKHIRCTEQRGRKVHP